MFRITLIIIKTNKFDNTDEMDKFLERHNLSKHTKKKYTVELTYIY